MTKHPQILSVFRRMINSSSIKTPELVPQVETPHMGYMPLFRNVRIPVMENRSFT